MNHDRGNLDSRAPYKAMDWIARVEIEWTESPRRTRRTQAWKSGDHRHSPPHPPRPRFKVTEATRATAGNVALLRHTLGCWSRWAVHRGPSAIA